MKRKYTQEEVEAHMMGCIYINPDDLNIFVRRRGVYSYTMNLGNKWSWLIMLIELIAIVLLLVYLL